MLLIQQHYSIYLKVIYCVNSIDFGKTKYSLRSKNSVVAIDSTVLSTIHIY